MRNRDINKRIYDYLNLIIFYAIFSDTYNKTRELKFILDKLKSEININIEYYKKRIKQRLEGINICRVLSVYKRVYKIKTEYPEVQLISYRYIGNTYDVEIKINILESFVMYLNDKLELADDETDLVTDQACFILKNPSKFEEFIEKCFNSF